MKGKLEMKRILLIEDNPVHGSKTKMIINQIPNMFDVNLKCFDFMPQNGDRKDTYFIKIKETIQDGIKNNEFDILMIDMLLGGDSTDNPLGLEIIKSLINQLNDKTIIAYTEMSNNKLDLVREYNKTVNNKLRIVPKPNSFINLSMTDICEGKYKDIKEQYGNTCDLITCDSEKKLQCAMECIFYSI